MVTLLTDFGAADSYVAAMKGVILSLAPQATVIDASHEIPPQNVRAGAWVLGQYWNFYPDGTIHAAVVDPGVGTDRDALLVEADGYFFLAPDNGLLSWVLKQAKQIRLRKLRPDIHRPGEVSSTFHGRDVFAYAAGLLAAGRSKPEDISDKTNSVIVPSWAVVRIEDGRIVGEIAHIDRFGNLITNITKRQVEETGWTSCLIRAGPTGNIRLCKTYGDSKTGELIALYGSSGTLELAVSDGSAQKQSRLTCGATVIVQCNKTRS